MIENTPVSAETPGKVCTKCKERLAWSAFVKKKGTDKWYSWCRRCTAICANELTQRKRESRPGYKAKTVYQLGEDHACSSCGEFQGADQYIVNAKSQTLGHSCKKCRNEINNRNRRLKMQQRPGYRPIVPVRDGLKQCNQCFAWKPFDQYSHTKHGRPFNPCFECRSRIGTERKYVKFGLPAGSYDRMLQDQGGRCAICGKPANLFDRRLSIDHCHTTNLVRGLLCRTCNHALGLFYDSIPSLQSAIRYLKAAKQKCRSLDPQSV